MLKKTHLIFLFSSALLISFFLFFIPTSKIPELSVTTIAGTQINLYEVKNKFTIINFWATNCPGCINEMPNLIATYNKFNKQGLEIIAVSMSYDPPNQVLDFTQKNKIPFNVVLDVDGKIAKSFKNIRLTPTSILVDKNGRIVDQIIGEIDFIKLHTLLKAHLNS